MNLGTKLAQWMAVSLTALALVGCGGGGDDKNSSASTSSASNTSSSSSSSSGSTGSVQITTGQQSANNQAPSISGTPVQSLSAGTAFNFVPQATDADNDALSFSIQNKPSWATFSIATGQLSGTPTTSDVASYSNIAISVSDGKATSSITFSVNVTSTQTGTGSATVTWTAPTQNTDGSAATNLTGYTILYGNNASALTQTVQIANVSLTTYTIANLAPGTWYFAVKALSGSSESASSAVGSKTI